jgi:hypothetical protein
MPGFAINNTSGAQSKDHKAEFRRKHRWRFTVLEDGTVSPRDFLYLQKAGRPAYKIEEAPVHHDQEVAYFAGKQEWEPLTLEFYDAIDGAGVNDISNVMWEWVRNSTVIESATVEVPALYKNTLQLEMTNGAGAVDETWILFGSWVKESNWNDLDYTSSDVQLVSVTIRFDRAEKQ